MPVISVVIPCFNYGRYLGQCLRSVFGQRRFSDYEVIVIDDASTDETPKVAGDFRDPRLVYRRHEKNEGHIRSANEGLALSKGPYLMRLDADDYLAEDFFDRALAIFQKNPEIGLLHGNFSMVNSEGCVTAEAADTLYGRDDHKGFGVEKLLLENFICPPSVIARRRAWEGVGMKYDEKTPYAEDWWVWLRMGLRYPFYYLGDVVAYYRVHSRSIRQGLLQSGQAERSLAYILREFFLIQNLPVSLRRLEAKAYGAHYLRLSNAYFGLRMLRDCRRCLKTCARRYPPCLLSVPWWRRFILVRTPAGFRRLVQR